ncbi:MAG: DEAD/DEAH box helicase [Thermodesulfobacteriota bacterium]
MTTSPREIERFVQELQESGDMVDNVVHHQVIPPREQIVRDPTIPFPSGIEGLLRDLSLSGLYSHQAEALDSIRQGENVVVSTPTASGKTFIYVLPVLQKILQEPSSKNLFIFPLKALAQDQLRNYRQLLQKMGMDGNAADIYDGDTPQDKRSRIRANPPNMLLTNPEMLHLGILPYHHNWHEFLSNLDHIIVDEVHTYRGIMGSNMSWVFRRLLRICRHYGANPKFVFCSATIGNPGELASSLTGVEARSITENGAPQGKRHFLFMNSLEGAARCSMRILESALSKGLRTIVYSQSRKMTELIALWTSQKNKKYAHLISAYRSGLLPQERREIEEKMARGDLLAVVSTSALELGIDIGGLDLCVLVGYPGSVMATWQRAGRVGRKLQDSAVVLIGHEDNLDQYFMANPENFFRLPPEDAVINPYNPAVMNWHLMCAAADLPLQGEEDWLGQENIVSAVSRLEESGELLRSGDGRRLFPARKNVHREVNLRGAGKGLNIINRDNSGNIGSIDHYRAQKETHPGAVYLHRGKTFVIDELLPDDGLVTAHPAEVKYFTRPRSEKEAEILECYYQKDLGATKISLGKLRVTEKVVGYEKRKVKGQTLISVEPLDLDPMIFETEGLWLQIPHWLQKDIEREYMHFMGGIHALEHGMIGVVPLLVLSDRNDLGGISHPAHPQLECAGIFVYDAIPGGVGLTRQAFAKSVSLLQRTWESLASCTCEYGCPSCVHSPKCGSGNRPLDKLAALTILRILKKKMPEKEASSIHQSKTCQFGSDSAHSPSTEDKQAAKKQGSENTPVHYAVLDLETQYGANEVGGWKNSHKMGVSCAVLFDSESGEFRTYLQDGIRELVEDLTSFDLVVGFNISKFDYSVLKGYVDFDFRSLPTLDMLAEVHKRLGYRLSLDHLASATLGSKKNGDGLLALKWWKNGEMEKIISYCQEDVNITRQLYLFGHKHGYVLFKNKAGKLVRLQVNW